ncbi:MAG: NB-ARC domain-containing protein [Microcoleus anatoxicus]
MQRGVFSHNNIVNSNNNKINVCGDRYHSPVTEDRSPTSPPNSQQTPKQPYIDLGDAPEIFSFFDRTTSLTTLKQWILHENTRLVAIHGIVGIGKTAIAAQLVQQIKHEFDFVIWRSLATSPPLSILQKNIIQFFRRGGAPVPAPSPEEGATTGGFPLLEYLQKYRCLLILDDVQMINSSGQLAGDSIALIISLVLGSQKPCHSHKPK